MQVGTWEWWAESVMTVLLHDSAHWRASTTEDAPSSQVGEMTRSGNMGQPVSLAPQCWHNGAGMEAMSEPNGTGFYLPKIM